MRSLLFHCKEYKAKVTGLSNRPRDIQPEKLEEKEQKSQNCIVAFITVEKDDDITKTSEKIVEEILKFSSEVGHNNVVIAPFAHLSKNLETSKKGISFFD